jgi:hypothetical protein
MSLFLVDNTFPVNPQHNKPFEIAASVYHQPIFLKDFEKVLLWFLSD